MAISGEIGRLIYDILGLVCAIATFTVGAVCLTQLNTTTLIRSGTGEKTAAISMISNYGSAGTIVGAVLVIIFLRDMILTDSIP
jgi:hypothetical protein